MITAYSDNLTLTTRFELHFIYKTRGYDSKLGTCIAYSIFRIAMAGYCLLSHIKSRNNNSICHNRLNNATIAFSKSAHRSPCGSFVILCYVCGIT